MRLLTTWCLALVGCALLGALPGRGENSGPELVPQIGHFVTAASFSADGRWLATGSDQAPVKLWTAANGELFRDLQGIREPLAFSPEGLLAGTAEGGIRILEPTSGEVRRTLPSAAAPFSFGGRGMLATASPEGREILLWDTATGKVQKRLGRTSYRIETLLFSPDGARLACRAAKLPGPNDRWRTLSELQLWDPATGKVIRSLPEPEEMERYPLAFSPDSGRLVAGGRGKIRVWDARSGEPVADWAVPVAAPTTYRPDPFPGFEIHSLAFSPQGHRLAAGGQMRVPASSRADQAGLRTDLYVLDTITGRVEQTHPEREQWSTLHSPLLFSPDGNLLLAGNHLRNPGTLRPAFSLPEGSSPLEYLRFTADGREVQAASLWAKYEWDAATGELTASSPIQQPRPLLIPPDPPPVVSPDGRWQVARKEGKVEIRETGRDAVISTFQNPLPYLGALVSSPDSRLLIVAGGNPYPDSRRFGSAWVWDVAGKRRAQLLEGHREAITDAAFSPDGSLLVTFSDYDGQVRLWDTHTWRCLRDWKAPGGGNVDFTSPSQLALSTSSGVVFWHVKTARPVRSWKLPEPNQTVEALNGRAGVAVTSDRDGAIRVLRLESGQHLATLRILNPGEDRPEWIAHTPDGHYTASRGADRWIRWREGGALKPASAYPTRRAPERLRKLLAPPAR